MDGEWDIYVDLHFRLQILFLTGFAFFNHTEKFDSKENQILNLNKLMSCQVEGKWNISSIPLHVGLGT